MEILAKLLLDLLEKDTVIPAMALRTLVTRNALRGGLGLCSQSIRGLRTFSLPDLPYDYGALEPAISADIMQLHHQKHHQTYVTNFNKALE
ncbi:Superoxide dismutase [Bertholletia excelsa]